MTQHPSPPRKPRVVIVCESLPPYRVALHARIHREVSAVDLFTACTHAPEDGRWPRPDPARFRVEEFGPGELTTGMLCRANWPHEWRKGGRLVAWLGRLRPSAVVVHGYNDPLRVRVLAWCRANAVPAFVSGDNNVRLDRATGLRRAAKHAYLRPLLRLTAGAMPFGTLGRAYYRRYGVPPSRIFLVPLEPDYAAVRAAPPRPAAAARLGLSPGRRRLIYSGRLAEEKRVDLLLAAFAGRVAVERPGWDLVVLGGGPERDALARLVPPGLAGRVHWVGARTDPADVFAAYKACDVLVLPSDYEPWALVVNEAAAAGLPVVCSDVVGAGADLVRDGVTGRVFPSGDAAALADALLDVTADDERLGRLGVASADAVDRWRHVADPVQGLRAALRAVGVIGRSGDRIDS